MVALPTFVSTSEAANLLGITEVRLQRMIEAGKLKAANVSGETVVSEASLRKIHKHQPIKQPSGFRKDDLPEYLRFVHLKGIGIWARQAEIKYGIPNQTINRWVQKGFIAIIGKEKNKIFLNEQDVAYCAGIYHLHRGRGKWLFNADGTPYISHSNRK